MEKKEIVSVCKALSDENRLRMFKLAFSEEEVVVVSCWRLLISHSRPYLII